MPLVAVAVCAYALSLLAAFQGAAAGAFGVAGALALLAIPRRSAVFAGIGAIVAAGCLTALAQTRASVQCLRTLERRRLWHIGIAAEGAPGAFVGGRSTDCSADAVVNIERGTAPAGSIVSVRGQLITSRRGVVIQHASIAMLQAPGPLDLWRARSGARIDSLYGRDAPLVRALLIADKRELSPEIRDRFAAAGLAHMLCISGLHVGILAYACALLLHLLAVPRRVVAVVLMVLVATYVAAIGAPPSAIRAAAMLGALHVSRLLQRPTSPWAILALGAAAPIVNPTAVQEVGYQLSVISVAALIGGSSLCGRILPRSLLGWKRDAVQGVIISALAAVVTAPLVAWIFGRISIIGPLTNLFAGPVLALLQPTLFVSLLLSPVPILSRFAADAAHPLLVALDWIAATAAAIPFARLELAPTLLGALVGGMFAAAVVAACVSPQWPRALIAAASLLATLTWLPLLPQGSGMTELHMLDVGQGDAIALRTPAGNWVLFDAGRAWFGGDAGRATVVPYLTRRGGRLALFVLSHPHTDHVGGAATVIKVFRPGRYLDAAFAAPTVAYRASLLAARQVGTRWQRVHPGDSVIVDGLHVDFLGPDSAWTVGLKDPNLASTIALVRAGNVRFLIVGDAEGPEEDWLLARDASLLHADVLKVGHHGSNTSSTEPFLDAVHPRLALISVGAGNMYGHPSPSVLAALAHHGAAVLRTDIVGSVVVRTDGSRIWVDAHGESWQLAPSSTP